MNFTQMHDRLRMELLRRIQRGSLSVSLLARQTGLAQGHVSNFLHGKRKLSLATIDRLLQAQHLAAADLISPQRVSSLSNDLDRDSVPVVSHAVALFEPVIRPSAVQFMLQLPSEALRSLRPRPVQGRRLWQRFVAIRIPAGEALAMDPIVLPDAIAVIDRHYNSFQNYRPNRSNIYVVRHGAQLRLRYVDFLLNRLVLRPGNMTFAVDLIETGPGETPNDLLTGRVAMLLNEV